MALDDVERNAEKKGVVENDPLAGQVQNQDLAQLGKERRITSETDTSALQAKGTVPQLELDGTAGEGEKHKLVSTEGKRDPALDLMPGAADKFFLPGGDGEQAYQKWVHEHGFVNRPQTENEHLPAEKSAYITLQPGLRHLGFPDTGDPFQKEWVDKNEGKWEGLWRGIKGLFGGHETLEDKAKEREIANLTPEQRKQYEKEEKELSAWKTREGTMMSIAYQGSPPPDCPMHREVERRVAQFEQGVKDEVVREMTPEQRRELERERQEYEREYKQIHAHDNPMAGPLYQRNPTPGPTMEYYKKMVQKRAEERLG